jgi:hypothetical protein
MQEQRLAAIETTVSPEKHCSSRKNIRHSGKMFVIPEKHCSSRKNIRHPGKTLFIP